MNELLQSATVELARFLTEMLPPVSEEWWQRHVVNRLSFSQQRMVEERGIKSLQQLDLAALLRVLDSNWRDLSFDPDPPREARNWLKELQTVRNKWAHLSSESISAGENFRDADTLARFLGWIGAAPETLAAAETLKDLAVAKMAENRGFSAADSREKEKMTDDSTPQDTAGPNHEMDDAPFKAGDLVALTSQPEIILPVLEVIRGGAERRYAVFQDGTRTTYYESQLQSPKAKEELDRKLLPASEMKAALTSLHLLSPSTSNLFSLRAGRVQFVPYQYRPVLKLIRSDRPRLLIADEVGVGKTIEAGLIIKELRARRDLSSVLIICPKALVAERKWELEMKRFDEQFEALDGQRLRHCLNETELDGEWPERHQKAILPFSLIDSTLIHGKTGGRGRDRKGLLNLDPPPKFDLVIVDEAHNIRNSDTFLHQGVRFFCENAEAVLFLSATPVQLGSDDLYTLLNVLRPDLVIDPASFNQMAEPNPGINGAIGSCRSKSEGWQEEALNQLARSAQTPWGQLFLREAPAFQAAYDRLAGEAIRDHERVALIGELEALYTFSGLINRTRRRDIGEFTTRKPETVTIEFTTAQKKLHDGLLEVVARILQFCHGAQNVKFMMTTIRRQAASSLYGLAPLLKDILSRKSDQLDYMTASDGDGDLDLGFVDDVRADIEGLLQMAEELDDLDPKVEAFKRVVSDKGKMDNNKALLFSTFRHTLSYLSKHVEAIGLRYGLIHGSIPDDERAALRRRFALPKDDPDALDILLSSEVGCEGLDFQFCDMLVNYDLPWNPMKIEQRIGRIDRYGQKSEAVAIVNFVTPGTVDADIYQRCLMRIGVFEHAIGGSEEILGEITKEIHDIAENFELTATEREARIQQLSDNGIRQIREEQDLENKQTELFGLNIPSSKWEEEIEAAESHWLSAASVERCVRSYLAQRLGADTDHLLGEKPLKTLRLSQEARSTLLEDFRRLPKSNEPEAKGWERWLRGGQPTLAVTFAQAVANESATVIHLWCLHPLVRQAANYCRLKDVAHVSLAVRSTLIPPGDYQFALYRWRMQGVKIDERIEPVTSSPEIEQDLLELIADSIDRSGAPSALNADFDGLESRHHEKWTRARAEHVGVNQQAVEHRRQSLKVSHQARCRAIEDQIQRANNPRIEKMKRSELASANADYDRRMAELDGQASSGDIHAAPLVFGTIQVETKEAM